MKPSQVGPRLSKIVECQVLLDNQTRNLYSVDASSYILKPQAVAFPRNESDVVKIIKFAKKHCIQITPRGAGAGLVGSALGKGIILDMRHFDEIKIGDGYVKVGSGVFKGRLDKVLQSNDKFIGPDPSIGPYCTIGGMIGTNASGIHSLKYGSMVDNLIQVKMVNASVVVVKLPDNHDFNRIIKKIHSDQNISFPKVSKNSCGYRIDRVSSKKDLHKLIAGSEGTLGIITSAKVRTYRLPKDIVLYIIHYKTLHEAVRDVPKINELRPSAVEIADNNITKHIKINIPSRTGCLLFVEFDNATQTSRKIHKIASGVIIRTESNKERIRKIWIFRNSALAYSLQSLSKNEIMPNLIEDAVVPVKRLPLLLSLLEMISKKYGFKIIIYGHAGNGNLHIMSILKQRDVRLIKKIASEFFSGVISIGGSISAEHGDGLARSEFVKMQYNKKTYNMFRYIKKQFDPKGILNPGKIVSNQSTVTRNLKI